MKKLSLFVALLLACFLFLDNQYQFSNVSAQTVGGNSARQGTNPQDLLLADTIKRLTNRSTDGLIQKREASGNGFSMDLGEGFQNVMLSKIDTDGEPVAACVTSVEEANAFLGKNLETGEAISSTMFQKDDNASIAARHGMTENEFEFYKKLIEDAAQQRALSPDAATITIINNDDPGEGFNDATAATPEGGNTGTTRAEQRLNLFNFAAGIWGAYLDTSVEINVNSKFDSLSPCTSAGGVLGSAGTARIYRDFSNAQYPATWYHVALANKRQGTDLNATESEINARFNSDIDNGCLGAGTRFYYGLNNTTPGGRINLLVVLLHEMGHGLGFSSFVTGSTGALNAGFPDVYTRFMFDRSTNKYWHEMTNAERVTSSLNTSNVLWDGPNVKGASGNLTNGRDTATGRVQLFTPNPLQQGSSISHFDSAVFTNVLMEPVINTGLPIDLDLTRQQMRDIGWYRDTNADLVPDTITNVTPSGNTVVIGTAATITWTNTGGFSRNVTIDLSTDGGATYPTILATNVANSGTFTFTVPNTPTTQARVRVREHNFVEPAGFSAANFAISTTAAPTNRAVFDYDGDGKTDVSIFRPSSGEWWINRSQSGSPIAFQFGSGADKIAPADYTGDGKTDVAIFRPATGEWFVLRSENQSFYSFPFGNATDIPAPADFDGDGKADAAVFRPSEATWYIRRSTDGGTTIQSFGQNGDVPVVADYDGDNKADIAIYRVASGEWWIQRSNAGLIAFQFGNSADKTVQGDYTGDGKADVAIFRPSTREWFVLRSENQSYYAATFGATGDTPTPGDYDGDGKADFAVFRASEANWYLQRSTAGFTAQQFGNSADLPTPNAFVR
jgi:hypothetical protein